MSGPSADVLIIGTGVAAATVARSILNSSDRSVLMLEAGGTLPMGHERRWQDLTMKGLGDHNRPYAYAVDETGDKASYDNTGPPQPLPAYAKYPEHKWGISGSRLIIKGGTQLHWGGWSLRMKPEDFRLNTQTNKGLDWTFGYDELEPYYTEAERLFQVAGKEGDTNQPDRRSGKFPFRNLPYAETDAPLLELWKEKGIGFGPMPIARNTIRNQDVRLGLDSDPVEIHTASCRTTGTCKYCPVRGKFTNDQSLEYIEENSGGRLRIVTHAVVRRILLDNRKATGVVYLDKNSGTDIRALANDVIVCAGALETPKLLINSGIQNEHLGRHLTAHPMFVVRATRQVDRGMQQELHFPTLCSRHFDSPETQAQGKLLLAKYYTRPYRDLGKMIGTGKSPADIETSLNTEEYEIRGFVENAFHANTTVGVAEGHDQWGLPRTKLTVSGKVYPEETIHSYLEMMTGWMTEMGYTDKLYTKVYPPRGDHAMSTTRLASSPEYGVVDDRLKVFGTDNIYVVSNAVFPNVGAVNPTLTLGAVSLRFAKQFLEG